MDKRHDKQTLKDIITVRILWCGWLLFGLFACWKLINDHDHVLFTIVLTSLALSIDRVYYSFVGKGLFIR